MVPTVRQHHPYASGEVSPVTAAPTFANATDALVVLEAAAGYLAAAEPAEMPDDVRTQCLKVIERTNAMTTAARAGILGRFITAQGYLGDGDFGPKPWLLRETGVSRNAAHEQVRWSRRLPAHPRIDAAMRAGAISVSVARIICDWTGHLPANAQDAADRILLEAWLSGADMAGLAGLFAEIRERSHADGPDDEPGRVIEDRCVRLETTLDGAGILTGDLTPECAGLVRSVLEELSKPIGADDGRTLLQRQHDALEESMRRLAGGQDGPPARAWVHMSLADLINLDDYGRLREEWTADVRAQWAAARAAASAGGGDGSAWVDGDAGLACGAALAPVVTGGIDPAVLEDMVKLCRDLDGTGPTDLGKEALELAVIGKAVDLVSGPSGLAGFLRRRQLGARLAGPSLPLDIGYSDSIPASIRNAVRLRDQHCRWAGGCDQPAGRCHVHHIRHKVNGGKTSLKECILLCPFHHLVVIHQMGWTLVLNEDGTTTAWSPDRTKVLRSHGPPPRPGLPARSGPGGAEESG
jgi:hypothetical protein